jgi:hypothetical protein
MDWQFTGIGLDMVQIPSRDAYFARRDRIMVLKARRTGTTGKVCIVWAATPQEYAPRIILRRCLLVYDDLVHIRLYMVDSPNGNTTQMDFGDQFQFAHIPWLAVSAVTIAVPVSTVRVRVV